MMLVASSFDLWQKDAFFSAAEEVQQSADIMESAYRTWERQKREGLTPEDLDELCRELQTALGTAKWQLEEFEKAVRLSYGNRADDFTMARHRQFVDAMENQISRVETALRESFSERGKQPLQWVNLNEEECNDLAAFLSGTPGTVQSIRDDCAKYGSSSNSSTSSSLDNNIYMKKQGRRNTKAASNWDIRYHTKGSSNVLPSNKDAKYAIDIRTTETSGTVDDINFQADMTSGTRKTGSSLDDDAWKIVIANEDVQNNASSLRMEVTPKDKGSKPGFWRQRCSDPFETKGGILSYSQLRGIRWINQIRGQVGGYQRQLQTPLHLKLSSARVKLVLLLTIFLVVPFVLYST